MGLGNPGPGYARTRHNVGFLVVRRLARRWKISWEEDSRCRSKVGEGSIEGHPVRLALPQTFMNSSGEAVACLAKKWRLKSEAFLAVCDDFALPLGTVRLRGQGSEGGHQGLASILREMGTREVARLRVGIGGPRPEEDWTPFVLGRFAASEQQRLAAGMEQGTRACESWAAEGLSAAMSRFNRRKVETR